MSHWRAELTPVAECRVLSGVEECFAPANGGTLVVAGMSVDERLEESRVFLRQDTLLGLFDGDRLHVERARDQVREESGCLTQQSLLMDGLVDDPGLGLRREITGTYEERNLTSGDPSGCGRSVPYGSVTKYRLVAVEVSQP
jgi:hypothetical protein